jgi:hypothetical protein
MIGKRFVRERDATSEMVIATMNAAVARKIGSPTALRTGKLSAICSPLELKRKKTPSGPNSKASFKSGDSSLRDGSFGARSNSIKSLRCSAVPEIGITGAAGQGLARDKALKPS